MLIFAFCIWLTLVPTLVYYINLRTIWILKFHLYSYTKQSLSEYSFNNLRPDSVDTRHSKSIEPLQIKHDTISIPQTYGGDAPNQDSGEIGSTTNYW